MFGIGGSLGTNVNDFLGFFGIKGAGVGLAIDSLTGNSIGQLRNLQDMYLETALGRGTGPIERMMGTGFGMGMGMGMPGMGMGMGMPPFMGMMSPMNAYPMM